jgi:hypothetical protein
METIIERLPVTNNSSSSDSPDERNEEYGDGDCAMEGTEPLQDF